jgi:LmbE family N-acetylglucosaminyl deacetylase
MKILIVAAHPDDEVLGCGATAARLARAGHAVYISILGEGLTSRAHKPDEAARSKLEGLNTCARRAAESLGARQLFLHQLPDNRFDTVALLDVVKIVEDLIADLSPEVIYTHHGGDLNLDHQITHRAVLTATRPSGGNPVREVYAFEIASSTEWSFQRLESPFRPNVFVDISATLDTKLAAMALYESEVRRFPHPRSGEALAAAARRWGSVAGCNAAEAFELIRSIRLQGDR